MGSTWEEEEIEYLIAILSNRHRKKHAIYVYIFYSRRNRKGDIREYKRAMLPDGRETVAATHTAVQLEASATNVKIMRRQTTPSFTHPFEQKRLPA